MEKGLEMSNKKDSLGDRMKNNYENISRLYLTRRTPVIIRLDGKAFHAFTKGLKKPFDDILVKTMQDTMKYLCENIQGCVLGYTQSDEISLVLIDYQTLTSDAWFGYNVQKMCSVAASMATLAFNREFRANGEDYSYCNPYNIRYREAHPITQQYIDVLYSKFDKAMFDARCFNIPKEEVCNAMIWRQNDATRNSIQSVGQANFSHKELDGKSCNDIQDMLMTQKSINWNDYPTTLKRGSCCIKEQYGHLIHDELEKNAKKVVIRSRWVVDNEIPIFSQDRDYIERFIYV